MDIFEKQNGLRLTSIPNRYAPIEARGNKQVFIVQAAQIVNSRILKLVGGQWSWAVVACECSWWWQLIETYELVRLTNNYLVTIDCAHTVYDGAGCLLHYFGRTLVPERIRLVFIDAYESISASCYKHVVVGHKYQWINFYSFGSSAVLLDFTELVAQRRFFYIIVKWFGKI